MKEDDEKQTAMAAEGTAPPDSFTPASPPPPPMPTDGADDDAIDDSDDADEATVDAQRSLMQARLLRRASAGRLLKKVIPSHWAPMLTPLTESDIETCVTLEELAFDGPEEGATREQIEYRIRNCGSICFGLFNTYRPDDAKDWWIGTMRHSRPVETGREDNAKRVLFAHAIATLGVDPVVTDNDMGCPENWRTSTLSHSSPLGHKYFGRTIVLHSFAVCPEVQGVGIGKFAMKSYLQLMNESGVADRVALVCKTSLIDFFRRCGFKHVGRSQSTSLTGDWHNMVVELPGPTKPAKVSMKSGTSTMT